MAQVVETLSALFLHLHIKERGKSMVKAVFFDLDGTLISSTTGEIPQSARKAIDQLRMNQIKIFTATGRHMSEMQELPVEEIPFDGHITLNGQLCLDSRREVFYSEPISERDVKQMLGLFEERSLPVMLVEMDRMYINYIDEKVEKAQEAIKTPIPEIGFYSGEPIYQFILYSDERMAEKITAGLDDCKMSRWNPYAVDIIAKNGGKVAGIQQILKDCRIGQNEIMAFGDGENDMDMLRYAEIGIAMGNAEKKVKDCADFVTEHVDADGVEKALKYYKVI